METLLSKIVSGDRKCKLCDKSYFSTKKLKKHMRKRHLGKTPYQCGECHRYYGDSQSLKIHMKKHVPAGEVGQQFTCGVCNKTFPTVGKLNQHSEKHQDIRCEYCNKSFAYIRTMKAHAAEVVQKGLASHQRILLKLLLPSNQCQRVVCGGVTSVLPTSLLAETLRSTSTASMMVWTSQWDTSHCRGAEIG